MLALATSILFQSARTATVVFDGTLVIGSFNRTWAKPGPNLRSLRFPLTALRLGPTGTNGRVKIPAIEYDDNFKTFYIKEDNAPADLLVSGRVPRYPRPITKISPSSQPYLKVVKDYLVRRGYPRLEAKIAAAYEVDLNGDGKKEVLIAAANADDAALNTGIDNGPQNPGGDYSLILLRSMGTDGKLHTAVLDENYKPKGGQILILAKIDAIADLDGDGKYEIVTSWKYYEGNGAEIYGFKNGRLKSLAEVGVSV